MTEQTMSTRMTESNRLEYKRELTDSFVRNTAVYKVFFVRQSRLVPRCLLVTKRCRLSLSPHSRTS